MQTGERWAAAAYVGDTLYVWLSDAAGVDVLRGQGDVMDVLAPRLRADSVLPVLCAAGMYQGGAVAVPAAPLLKAVQVLSPDPRAVLYALPDMTQDRPADVMGAPVVQVAGFLAAQPEWDGVLCLTGAQSKWVHISAGEVVSFRSFMTGEMFGLLAAQSSLRAVVQGDGWDQPAFEDALSEAMSRPERMAATLAGLRAQGMPAQSARARLSGTLIGAEIAAAKPYWLGQNVALIGEGRLVTHYQSALAGQGVQALCHDASEMALRGMQAAWQEHMT